MTRFFFTPLSYSLRPIFSPKLAARNCTQGIEISRLQKGAQNLKRWRIPRHPRPTSRKFLVSLESKKLASNGKKREKYPI